MHDHHPTTILTTHDHEHLRAMMSSMIGARTPLAALLRYKLGSAVVLRPTDVDADVVTSGRRVQFKIDGYKSLERTLTWDDSVLGGVGGLSLRLPRGLSLLGLSVGQSMSYLTDARRNEFVEIEHVFPSEHDGVEIPWDQPVPAILGRSRTVTVGRSLQLP